MIKDFTIRESLRLEIRADACNSFNHPNLTVPNVAPANTAFGTVTATNGTSRSWQFGSKLRF